MFIIAFCSLLLRIGTNLSRVDENYAEGIYRGSVAKALADGLPLWPRHIAEIPHVPGSIYVGYIAWPFYKLLGPTTFSLRMAGTIFHLAALAAFMLLLHKRLGPRVAVFGGLLFAFAPPGFAKMAVLSYGDHVESLPFIFFAAAYTLDWVESRERPAWRAAFLAGFGVAFAVGFHLQATVGIAALAALSALVAIPRFVQIRFWKELFIGFLPGAALGALPAVLIYQYTTCSALTLWGKSPTAHLGGEEASLAGMIGKFAGLWRDGFAYSFQWPDRWMADAELLFAYACAAYLLFQWIRSFGADAKSGSLTIVHGALATAGFFVVYPLVFSVVYGISSSNFKVEDSLTNALEVRYALPVVPILLLPIAAAAAKFFDSGKKALAICILAPALALGIAGSLYTWDLNIIRREPARRGWLWEEFDSHFMVASLDPRVRENFTINDYNAGANPEEAARMQSFLWQRSTAAGVMEVIRKYDNSAEWTWPLRYLPPRVPVGMPPAGDAVKLLQWLHTIPAEYKIYGCVAAASALASGETYAPAAASAFMARAANPAEGRALARGFGHGLFEVVSDGAPRRIRFFDGAKAAERLSGLPPAIDRAEVCFAMGFRLGIVVNEFFTPGDWLIERVVNNFPPDQIGPFARGLGAGYRMRFLVPPSDDSESPGAARLLTLLPPGVAKEFRAGLGGSEQAK